MATAEPTTVAEALAANAPLAAFASGIELAATKLGNLTQQLEANPEHLPVARALLGPHLRLMRTVIDVTLGVLGDDEPLQAEEPEG